MSLLATSKPEGIWVKESLGVRHCWWMSSWVSSVSHFLHCLLLGEEHTIEASSISNTVSENVPQICVCLHMYDHPKGSKSPTSTPHPPTTPSYPVLQFKLTKPWFCLNVTHRCWQLLDFEFRSYAGALETSFLRKGQRAGQNLPSPQPDLCQVSYLKKVIFQVAIKNLKF